MADIIDQAQERAERILQAELSARRAAGPEATGYCLACGEAVAHGMRWCNVMCRDDYQRVEAARRRNGN